MSPRHKTCWGSGSAIGKIPVVEIMTPMEPLLFGGAVVQNDRVGGVFGTDIDYISMPEAGDGGIITHAVPLHDNWDGVDPKIDVHWFTESGSHGVDTNWRYDGRITAEGDSMIIRAGAGWNYTSESWPDPGPDWTLYVNELDKVWDRSTNAGASATHNIFHFILNKTSDAASDNPRVLHLEIKYNINVTPLVS